MRERVKEREERRVRGSLFSAQVSLTAFGGLESRSGFPKPCSDEKERKIKEEREVKKIEKKS
jgi:hypothetical protein